MHSVAYDFLSKTDGSEYRRRVLDGGYPLPFNFIEYDIMEKESHIVGMLMAWSVITLESLINHVLAENINDKADAVKAIEYPGQLIKKYGIRESKRSGLANKMIIIYDNSGLDIKILDLCDELSMLRNYVVHDKPFDYIDLGDDGVEIDYYRSLGKIDFIRPRYHLLDPFFMKCDRVKDYILNKTDNSPFQYATPSFSSLLNAL